MLIGCSGSLASRTGYPVGSRPMGSVMHGIGPAPLMSPRHKLVAPHFVRARVLVGKRGTYDSKETADEIELGPATSSVPRVVQCDACAVETDKWEQFVISGTREGSPTRVIQLCPLHARAFEQTNMTSVTSLVGQNPVGLPAWSSDKQREHWAIVQREKRREFNSVSKGKLASTTKQVVTRIRSELRIFMPSVTCTLVGDSISQDFWHQHQGESAFILFATWILTDFACSRL